MCTLVALRLLLWTNGALPSSKLSYHPHPYSVGVPFRRLGCTLHILLSVPLYAFVVFLSNIRHLVCFVSIIPLAKLLGYGGEQMAFYLGKDLGELVIITLNK